MYTNMYIYIYKDPQVDRIWYIFNPDFQKKKVDGIYIYIYTCIYIYICNIYIYTHMHLHVGALLACLQQATAIDQK